MSAQADSSVKENREASFSALKGFRLIAAGLLGLMIPGLLLYLFAVAGHWTPPRAGAAAPVEVTSTRRLPSTPTPLPLSHPWSTPAPLPTTVLCWKVGNNHAGPLEVCVINDKRQPLSVEPLGDERAKEILDLAGFHCLDEARPSWLCEEALRVARCESQMYITASGSRRQAYGLFQLRQEQLGWANQTYGQQFINLFDPVQNAQVAYLLWSTEGWAAWPACQP